MKRINKKIEITRVHQHFILDWEDHDKKISEGDLQAKIMGYREPEFSGTEIYDDKEALIKRLRGLL